MPEDERLDALHGYQILDTPPEQVFDDIVRLASQICGTPMAMVSLVDESRQWFKAVQGLAATQTSRDVSFCAIGMGLGDVFEVPDATRDDRFKANPLVTGDPNLRYYAGAPLVAPGGEPLGMLCVLDDKPRAELTESQRFALKTLAAQVMAQLELRRLAKRQLRDNRALSAAYAELAGRHAQQAEALSHAQRVETLGHLTGGIAHDFNNLLAAIKGSLELTSIRIRQQRFEDVTNYLATASAATNRAAALTRRLLSFARVKSPQVEAVLVDKVILGLVDLLERTIGPTIVLQTSLAPGLKAVACDAAQLENALLNLCINARDAMPLGGTLSILAVNCELARTGGRDDPRLRPCVRIDVRDSGTGMSPEVRQRAMEPFFTTKGEGQGTGLGLSMIADFVRQAGGDLQIDTHPGQGTCVSLSLLAHSGPVSAVIDRPPSLMDVAGARPASVLVVDDESYVRLVIADTLREQGYEALEAPDGLTALDVLSAAQIDLLVCDVGLRGSLSGYELAERARQLLPSLKVLFITGFQELLNSNRLPPDSQIMRKPFELADLAQTVADMLSITAGGG